MSPRGRRERRFAALVGFLATALVMLATACGKTSRRSNYLSVGHKESLASLVLSWALVLAVVASMLDVVHLEGDHTSYLVLAPYPTPGFVQGGGEEGAWRRAHPGEPDPWWLAGHYVVIAEVTDS